MRGDGRRGDDGGGARRGDRARHHVGTGDARPRHRLRAFVPAPPRLYSDEGTRHATWLELFFGLVYVVAVAQLGLLLHDDLTVTGFVGSAGPFFAVWWTWLGFTNYADQFDTDDVVHRAMLEPLHDHVFVARIVGSVLLVALALVVPPVAPLPLVGLVVVLLVGLNVFEGFRACLDSRVATTAS